MLYIVSTPIGNLEDISQRALKILKECDAILCEDTRRTQILLDRFGIEKPLFSYHKFNEIKNLEKILGMIESGKKLSLVSDAGTPCINDPGGRLVSACIERNIPFTAIPGPCSLIQAIVLSGFEANPFQFIGFLPKKPQATLRKALFYPGSTLAFESPERMIDTLTILQKLDPSRKIAALREMTKVFEECKIGTPQELLKHFQNTKPRGEITLVLAPGNPPEEILDLTECVDLFRTLHGLSLKEAIKQTARLSNNPKKVVYNQIHQTHHPFKK
jgi:16S rRNA (cytidine1402-2'-O)-methyltransferase